MAVAARRQVIRARPVGVGVEQLEVDPAGDDVDTVGVGAEVDELAAFVAAAGRDGVGPGRERDLVGEAAGRAGVGAALVAPLDHAEGVERLEEGHVDRLPGALHGQPGHPEMGVGDVGDAVGEPVTRQRAPELVHVRGELVLRQRSRGAGGDVDQPHPLGELDRLGRRGRFSAGVDGDVVAPRAEAGRQLGDVDVLPARVLPAERGQWTRVFRYQGDPHVVTSCRTVSQSARKRPSP